MMQLTPMQRKASAFAILLFVLVIVISAIVVPLWLLNRRYDLAVDDAAVRLERYSRIVGMREGLQTKGIEVKALAAAHHFLKSGSPALAAAELQERAKAILDENGGKLDSIQILPHKDDGIYRQVSVLLRLSAPLSSVKAMLHAFESARPYLFVDNFSVRVTNFSATRNESESDLSVQFELTGYALKGAQ